MNIVERYFDNNLVPERADLYKKLMKNLDTLGYTEHELILEMLVSLEDKVERFTLLEEIDNRFIEFIYDLLVKMYVVPRRISNVLDYLPLLEFLVFIENTTESTLVMYEYNEEVTPIEQLIHWCEIFMPEVQYQVSDVLLDVRQKVIDNIVDLHEHRVPIEEVEYDDKFDVVLSRLRIFRNMISSDSNIALQLVKNKQVKECIADVETIYNRYVGILAVTEPMMSKDTRRIAEDIIGMSLLLKDDCHLLKQNSIKLSQLMVDDLKLISSVLTNVEDILKDTTELCKTKNISN